MSAPDYAAVEALLATVGLTPTQVRQLDAVVSATSRATDNDVPDAIAVLAMAIGLFARLTRDPILALDAVVDTIDLVRECYRTSLASTRSGSVPS